MSTGTNHQDNTRITVCHDGFRTSSANYVNGNQDQFLAASLQFLHRLLAERTLEYAKLEGTDIPMSRLETEDIQQEGNNTAGQLGFQQLNQIGEYERQLCCMENFLSTIQLSDEKPSRNTVGCDIIGLNKTRDLGHCEDRQNFESSELPDNSYDFISQNPHRRISTYPRSFFNYGESPADISERAKVNVTRSTVPKTAIDVSNGFTNRLETHSAGVPTCTTAMNDGVQNSSSYADMVRNAVLGLARNCGKKYKNKRKKHAAKSWPPEARIIPNPGEEKHQKGYQSDIESEISSESQLNVGQDSDIPKEIPLCVQLAMDTDASPRKPVTLLVRVPNTVFNLLNRKISNRDKKISSTDRLAETRTEPGKRKKRITSVFRNLLKGRRTPSSSTVYSAKEEFPSHMSLVSEGTSNGVDNQGNHTSCNTSISTLQKSALRDMFDQRRSAELCCEDNKLTTKPRDAGHASLKSTLVPPTESANGRRDEEISLNSSPRVISYEPKLWNGKAAGTAWRKVADGKALRTEVPYNKTRIVKDLTNYRDEKIIPLRCSEGSPQLGNKHGSISQRDVDSFLKLAAEMRNIQVYQDADNKHVEIPIEIKTTETPLHLRKAQNVSEDLADHRVFHPELKNSHQTPNTIETQEFLEMLVGTLPEGAYLPQTKYSRSEEELPSALDSMDNEPQDDIQLLRISEDSALEVLLRHIATDASITTCTRPCGVEKDTVQTAPKRQLSKISVCYSSESLSGSDHETPEDKQKNSTSSQDAYRVLNHVLINEPSKSDNPQYFHPYEATQQNRIRNFLDDKIMTNGKSEDRHPSVKIRSSAGSPKVTKRENSNLISPFSTQPWKRPEPCSRTEVIIEEQNRSNIETKGKTQFFMDSECKNFLSIRESDNEEKGLCHPVLSKQICGDRKELADAMIRWWGPQINYSTTPSSRTQLSAYSVSINNLILRNG